MNKRHQYSEKDARINTRHISFGSFLRTYIILAILTVSQSLILLSFLHLQLTVPIEYIWGMLGYWAIVALVFCLVIAKQNSKTYDKPMHALSDATKKVADGDYSVRLLPLRKDGKKDYVEVMFEDFNKMVEELGSTELMKNDFIANVSHEIKTPLSIIQSYALALQREDLAKEKQKAYTDVIITASQKLTNLVTNILQLNKLENQGILPSTERYDLSRQLSESALSFEELWEKKDLTFVADMEDRSIIQGNKDMLEIVWNNLLSNAIKFTDPGGTIRLSQTSDAETVTVTIEDSGCGMDEKTLNRIFDKFYQGDTSHSQEGNGLGLALSLKVIELVGGNLSVKSELGNGTSFEVELKKTKEE